MEKEMPKEKIKAEKNRKCPDRGKCWWPGCLHPDPCTDSNCSMKNAIKIKRQGGPSSSESKKGS